MNGNPPLQARLAALTDAEVASEYATAVATTQTPGSNVTRDEFIDAQEDAHAALVEMHRRATARAASLADDLLAEDLLLATSVFIALSPDAPQVQEVAVKQRLDATNAEIRRRGINLAHGSVWAVADDTPLNANVQG